MANEISELLTWPYSEAPELHIYASMLQAQLEASRDQEG
jgi:hypothetical protein